MPPYKQCISIDNIVIIKILNKISFYKRRLLHKEKWGNFGTTPNSYALTISPVSYFFIYRQLNKYLALFPRSRTPYTANVYAVL